MPTFRTREIGVLVDIAGCPNRCRHCYLGCPPNKRVSERAIPESCDTRIPSFKIDEA